MPQKTSAFADLIEKDRAQRQQLEWRGTFLEYLDKVKADPFICKLAHARVDEAITRDGIQNVAASDDPKLKRLFGDEPLKIYPFFNKEFFGIERTIAQLVRYFHAASMHGAERRQAVDLMGSSGAG